MLWRSLVSTACSLIVPILSLSCAVLKADFSVSKIIAVQATVQSGNRNKKIRKSLVGLTEDITRDKKVIFILINPNWPSTDAMVEGWWPRYCI